MNIKQVAINWHMLEKCNYKCIFCFAKYNVRENENIVCNDINKSKKLISILKEHNIKKINFTGGEPLLCNNLGEIIKYAKKLDIITSVVTNGYYITHKKGKNFLNKYCNYIDWIGISIDSQYEEVERKIGRGFGDHVYKATSAIEYIKEYCPNIKLKINTTIFKDNYNENMIEFIKNLNPDRWKVFQIKLIDNINNNTATKNIAINDEQFRLFVEKHNSLKPVIENNDLMTDSYIILNPYGEFTNDNEYYKRNYKSVLNCHFNECLENIRFNHDKFRKRGGDYFIQKKIKK